MSRGAAVGLDIESNARLVRGHPLSIARRYFSDAELKALQGVGTKFHSLSSVTFIVRCECTLAYMPRLVPLTQGVLQELSADLCLC